MAENEATTPEQDRAEHINRLWCALMHLIPRTKRHAALGVMDALERDLREDEAMQAYLRGYQEGWAAGEKTCRTETAASAPQLTVSDPPAPLTMPDGEPMFLDDQKKITH